MVPASVPPVVWCSLWAIPVALVTPFHLLLGALGAALGWLWAIGAYGTHRRAGLAALPAFLAALAAPTAAPAPLPHGPVRVCGTVRDVQRAPETGTQRLELGDARAQLRVALDGELDVLPGDRLRLLAHATPPPAPGLPGSLHAVAATATVTPGPWSIPRLAGAAHRALARELLQRLPPAEGALLATLVLGRGTRPGRDLEAAHRATGLSHLLAVSGAHAAMLAFLLGLSGARGRARLLASRTRTAVVLLLLLAYAAITGCEPPVLRAVVAYTIAAVAAHLGRPCGLVPTLVAPAVLTAFVQPGALLGPSFLLSYAAVAGLFLAGPPPDESRLQRWLWSPLRASLWATLMTAPFTLGFFGQLAPWTVLLTPLLAPCIGALLLGGLATALAGLVCPLLADLLAPPLGALAAVYADAVRAADHLPGTPLLANAAPPTWLLGLAALAGALLVAWRPSRGRWAAAAGLGVLPHFLPLPRHADDALQLFAIGHGQACLVTTADGEFAAVDCGSLQLPHLAAERLLQALPQRALDLLVVTHADADHHNGVPSLAARCRIQQALVPQSLAAADFVADLRARGCAVRVLAPGERVAAAAHLTVFAPALPPDASDNDQSLWVSAALPGARVLMTGDAQEPGVAAALAAGIATPHDVLVLPHHGRKNLLAAALLASVRPRACLASAGCDDGETLLAPLVRRCGAELWVTGLHGSLRLFGDPPRITGDAGSRPLAEEH